LIIAVPREIIPGENRVALVPDTAAKLIKAGFQINIEKDAGLNASYLDDMYIAAGAAIITDRSELFAAADVVLKVQKPADEEIVLLKENTILISFIYPLNYQDTTVKLSGKKINVIAMDFIPRTTLAQRMDALSSQANLAGYKSVIVAANEIGKIFPLMMTAAGTITPSKVVIMGAGVAGLQALGTAKRLGAVVEVSDVRAAVKEEVQSLGGKFIEVEGAADMQDSGGYAKEATPEFLEKQKQLLFKHITEADIVITTALVPGRKAPILVTAEMVKNMRPGSVIVDMAVEFGGNCELSETGRTIKHNVKIIGDSNLPSKVAVQASEMYSKNLLALLQHISKEGIVNLNPDDEIVKNSLIIRDGEIVNQRILDNLKK
jgi:H+-translocating NAD(P) transhydrogenase subunit alpha